MDCGVEMQRSPVLGLSPSFNSYNSGRLAEIAARIIEELGESEFQTEIEAGNDLEESIHSLQVKEGEEESALFSEVKSGNDDEDVKEDEVDGDGDGDDDSEFAFVWREPETSPISADEIFYNGQIRPVFPIFNRDLLLGEGQNQEVSVKPPTPASIRRPLRKLLIEERGTGSCSSSEADELEGVPPGTYCVWTPKAAESPPARCRKSNSTGSSKRWKFRDFLHRSNSDGKDTFVFLTPNSSMKKKAEKEAPSGAGKPKPKAVAGENATSANRKNNTAAKKEGDRRRSFLPYRQDLVGFFANVNGLSRNLHPF